MKVSIQEESPSASLYAGKLARRLSLPTNLEDPDVIVWVSENGSISLSCPKDEPKARLGVSFHSGAVNHRRQFGGGKSQMIAKAVGIERGIYPSILDATAGLAGDAFVFASLGSHVKAIERSSLLIEMLNDARQRSLDWAADEDLVLAEVLNRLSFLHADATEFLSSTETVAEVIYLDPMFPERKKNFLVKKEMRILQRLLQDDPQNEKALLEMALTRASHRVVVKRPRHAPPIAGLAPNYVLEGKSTRFDIYPIKSLKASR